MMTNEYIDQPPLSTESDIDWTLDEYQAEAMRSIGDSGRAILGLGVAGEAGEVADLIKKELGHGHPADPDKMCKELGDVLWYVATLAASYDLTLDEVARANTRKLRARYPDGFSTAASIARVDIKRLPPREADLLDTVAGTD